MPLLPLLFCLKEKEGDFLQLCTLASGSSGNSLVLTEGDTHLLVDAGISCRKITTRLKQVGLTVEELGAILITHTHADHIGGLTVLLKRCRAPVYATRQAGADLVRRVTSLEEGQLHIIQPGQPVWLGGVEVEAFSTPHDAPGSVGYRFSAQGKRVAVVTDLGYPAPEVMDALTDIDLALVEANYDVDWLRNGPYPYYLQERVGGTHGHLSNEACGQLAVSLARAGTSAFVLAHLSRENNTPERARTTVAGMLEAAGCANARLYVAPRDELSQVFVV